MVVVVFRSRMKAGAPADLEPLFARMHELGTAMPGFRSFKNFTSPDGESVSIVEWDSLEAVTAWRNHPEHREAQRRGREEFFADFTVQVCEVVREARPR